MNKTVFDSTTQYLADYATNLTYDTISPRAIDATIKHLFDSIGCALGARHSRPAHIACRISSATPSPTGASVLGLMTKTTPEFAAFSNAVMIRHLDYNDTGIGGHPSDMIPSILALAEFTQAPGPKVIKGIYAAYEVVAGLRRGGLYGCILRKNHIDQVQSILGSVVGAGLMLDFDSQQMAHAISLALTPNIPLRVVRTGELSDWKGCATAHCSMAAVFATRLAQEGLTGPGKPFDGVAGMRDLLNIEPFDLSSLGQPQKGLSAIESTCYKWFPSEYSSQGPLGVILELRNSIPLTEIKKIVVQLHCAGWHEIGGGQGDREEKWNPSTRESADHSLPYLIAVALVDGHINIDSFTPVRIADPQLRPIMQKIDVVASEALNQEHAGELPRWPSITEITLKSGKQIRQHSGIPKGHPLNPLNEKELHEKFMHLSRGVLDHKSAQHLFETIGRLETLDKIATLTELFRFHVQETDLGT